ncbi:MAG: hypothetical protein KAI53_00900, partial [Candidatus Aenigmarchaeota archaeon]|nr:hypothetical protein [Candidatus Aenigmarchaeota archaeon]
YQIGTEFTYQLTTKTTLPLLKLYELEKMKIFNEMNWAEIQYIYSTPEIIADGKPNKYALIAKYTLVFISWFAVIWLLTRIRKLIINGWDC